MFNPIEEMFGLTKWIIMNSHNTTWMLEYVAVQTLRELDDWILHKQIQHNLEREFGLRLDV